MQQRQVLLQRNREEQEQRLRNLDREHERHARQHVASASASASTAQVNYSLGFAAGMHSAKRKMYSAIDSLPLDDGILSDASDDGNETR